jgi:type I restriction enzyme S subunit
MELMPGYKQTEVGVIPEDWTVTTLGAVYSLTNGFNSDKSAYGSGTRFINVLEPINLSHITAEKIPGRVRVTESQASAYAVRAGDIVLNRTSETDKDLGKIAVYTGIEQVVFGGFVIRGRQKTDTFDPAYSGYALRGEMVRPQIVSLGQGAVRANISQQSLQRVFVVVPPRPEQLAIARALLEIDQYLSTLDQLIAKKCDIRKAAMQELLTGKRRLPGFEGEWEVKSLGDIADVRSGGTPSTSRSDFWDGGVPWCTPTDITALEGRKYIRATARTISTAGLAASSAELIPALSLIMTSRATIGECAINQHTVTSNQGFKNLVPSDSVDIEYLYYFMCTQKAGLTALCSGSTFLEIGKKQVSNYRVLIPIDRNEQVAIAAILSEMDDELAALETRRDKTLALKQAMMQELLTGRIRLR